MTRTVSWLVDIIKVLVSSRFTGRITVDFYKGGIAKVLKTETVE